MKAAIASELLIVLLFVVEKMILVKGNVSSPFKGKDFSHLVVNIFFVSELRVFYLMVVVLLCPKGFVAGERRILNFCGDFDLDSKLFGYLLGNHVGLGGFFGVN